MKAVKNEEGKVRAAEAKAARKVQMLKQEQRQRVLNLLGPEGVGVRKLVGNYLRLSPEEKALALEKIRECEAII